MLAIEVLKEAHELLGNKRRWCQGMLARTVTRIVIGPRDPIAAQWCAVGAVDKVTHEGSEVRDTALSLLDDEAYRIYYTTVIGVNDSLGYKQMRAVYRAAIKRAEREGL